MESIKDGRTGAQRMPTHRGMCYLQCGWTRLPGMVFTQGSNRAMDPPRIIFIVPQSPVGRQTLSWGEPTNSSSHRCKLLTDTQGLPFLLTCILK